MTTNDTIKPHNALIFLHFLSDTQTFQIPYSHTFTPTYLLQISGGGGGPVTEKSRMFQTSSEDVWARLGAEISRTSSQNRCLTFEGGGGGGEREAEGGLEHTSFRLVVAPVTSIKGPSTVRPLVLL